jgi:Flp pilus assembly protein TadG
MSSVTTTRRLAPEGKGCRSPVPGALSITRFKSDERGNVALTFGLMIFMMIGFIGASVDIGRWLLARKQTQEAIDAAVLAGLRKYQESSDTGLAIQAAQVNYNYVVTKNGRGQFGQNPMITQDNIAFVLQNGNRKMTATGDVIIKTPFIGIATNAFSKAAGGGGGYIGQLPVLKTDGSENAVTEIAQGGNAGTNLEISVMIDITGSMGESDNAGSTKIETVKTAAKNMVDILVWADQSTYTSKIAIVPFSETVNLGNATNADKARGTYVSGATSTTPGSQYYKIGTTSYPISNTCVTERTNSDKYNDQAPTSSPVGRYYSTYGTSNGTGKCPTATPVMPLSSDKVALKATITSLQDGGTTAGHIGTAWAWYMLSPNFNTLWPSGNQARPYSDLTALTAKGRPVLRKIAVLMTDGDYNTEYCNGVTDWSSGCTPNNGESQSQALSLCTGMKAKGIEVYTIGAQVSSNAKTFLKSCATDAAHYYDATDGTKMQQAFMDIAYKLVPPYISH